MKRISVGAAPMLVLGLAFPAGITAGGPTPALSAWPDDHAAAFLALCDELEEAEEERYAAYQEKWGEFDFENATPEQREQVQQWWRDSDPSARFLGRFEQLAAKAKGTETAIKCWGKVLELAPSIASNAGRESALAALKALGETVTEPAMKQIAEQLQYGDALPLDELVALLGALREKSPHEGVQAAATYSLALQHMSNDANGENKAKARALLTELKERFAGARPSQGRKTYAQMAEGQLFELDHLQVGMVAPDMEALDVEGVKFRLSEFRGKVTVVDFWGHW